MRHNLASTTSETYDFNTAVFKITNQKSCSFSKNFKKYIARTKTTNISRRINYLCMMIRGESLRKFDNITSQNNRTTNANIKEIQQGLLAYFLLINTIPKKKIATIKPNDISMKRFSAQQV